MFSPHTHDSSLVYLLNYIIIRMHADDNAVLCIISDKDETQEVPNLPVWFQDHDLNLNIRKPMEAVMDFS